MKPTTLSTDKKRQRIAFMNRLSNPLMRWLLRSRLHFLVSESTLLLCYIGRKSGRLYATPVNYAQAGDLLRIVSFKQRLWWRNLIDSQQVVIHLRGTEYEATAEVVQMEAAVAEQLGYLVRQAPSFARYLQIPLAADGSPQTAALNRAAVERVVILLHLKQKEPGETRS